ncbi:hypothetical protein U1701_07115 [Sphingomonas sp. PB2P19]|uniref:hypothetical protein n=1 Tax=Sphingomonas rhamnosi TaxID=3096156 RepID=UPI002FCB7DD6
MTTIALPAAKAAEPAVTIPSPATPLPATLLDATADCDFSGDGRLCPRAERSAWACRSFYLAIPACAILIVAVAIVRLIGRLHRALR